MKSVFLLWHTHESPESDRTDEKLIGAYRREEDARAAIARVKDKPGFTATPEGFEISEYELNKDHWTEGYIVA